MLSVDVAGYLHVTPGEPPNRLFDLALAEPERTLRAEVLKQAEVRRPDVRGLLAWFEARDAFSATVVMDVDGPVGFILLAACGTHRAPHARRSARRARARRSHQLAAHRDVGAVARAGARNSRPGAPRDARSGSRAARTSARKPRRATPRRRGTPRPEGRGARPTRRRRDRRSTRSSARAERSSGIGLVTPPGVDPTGFAAHAHLASERAGGPFVSADCYAARRARARALERSRTIARAARRRRHAALARRRRASARGSRARREDARCATCRELGIARRRDSSFPRTRRSRRSPSSARSRRRCVARSKPEIALPALVDRAEDLRALVFSALARESARVGREPLGVDAGALRLLVEHTWPGNELELEAVLLRAVRVAAKNSSRRRTSRRSASKSKGRRVAAHEPFTPGPPPSTRRRAPRRWARGR